MGQKIILGKKIYKYTFKHEYFSNMFCRLQMVHLIGWNTKFIFLNYCDLLNKQLKSCKIFKQKKKEKIHKANIKLCLECK